MRWILALLAVLTLLSGVLLLSNRSLQHDLTLTGQQRDALKAQLQQRETLIATLNQQMRQRERAELVLRENLSTAQRAMQTREHLRQGEIHDDPQFRLWADTALPAAVSRLHQRPAFNSTGDYLRWLSGSQPVPGTVRATGN